MATLTNATILTRWTTELVEQMPHVEGKRYEVIGGELYATNQPHTCHQLACQKIAFQLEIWNAGNGTGAVIPAPGVVYAIDEAVAPDVVWVSKARLAAILAPDGKLHDSPELMIEILSPGKANEERDREKKLALYSRRDVLEYWIVDWRAETVDIFRREENQLQLVQTLKSGDEITSPLLPGFACPVARFFEL